MTLDDLTTSERLRLMRFVCSFAWADLEIADTEKNFVRQLVGKLNLGDDEKSQVEGWLQRPPAPEDVDPMDIPPEHRQIFLTTMMDVVGADGKIDEAEMENLTLLEQLLR
ncbi:MAG: TerB family tellurite resistance protein [Rhodobacterales bacterium]|nr:TerB family tellurite resistance protein [Rhodobacterales bacterium]